jgi:hypothetical protein
MNRLPHTPARETPTAGRMFARARAQTGIRVRARAHGHQVHLQKVVFAVRYVNVPVMVHCDVHWKVQTAAAWEDAEGTHVGTECQDIRTTRRERSRAQGEGAARQPAIALALLPEAERSRWGLVQSVSYHPRARASKLTARTGTRARVHMHII